ncbi:ABC transporter substrate-binding protein [Aquamicrobium sp. LC103]|uniref:ABC transporter substrate-binding protein n=1 Tax=Aquamicrobium sp. LC103 TaxID=1120658 RepID=UPI00063EA57B|nr:ABC transporter substrate-binding protein [Aquamicrobium sp. LC103]
MINRRSLLMSAAALAAAPSFARIASAATPGNIVVMAKSIIDVVNGFDPAEAYVGTDYEITSNVYRMLVTLDPEDGTKYVGDLAESWKFSDGGMTITFKLKPGILFESGNPVTAEDVVFSLHRLMKLNKYPAADFAQLGWTIDKMDEIVHAADELTVVHRLPEARAHGTVLNTLATPRGCVVDKATVLSHEVDGDFGNEWLKTHSAGAGAYRLVEWRPSDRIILEANPNAEFPPAVPRLLIRNVPDPATQLLLLQKGDIDVARNLGSDQIKTARDNPDLVELSADSTAQMNLCMNMAMPELQNPKVIEALKWAVDCEAIAKNITPDIWDVWQASFLPRNVRGAVPSMFQKDVEKAKALLAEAGYPDGFSITIDHFSSWPWANVAQAIQADLAEVGIKAELIAAETGQVITKYRARQHQLVLIYWATNLYDPDYNARAWCINTDDSDDSPLKSQAWRNHFVDEEMSELADAAGKELDADKRMEMYDKLQRDFMAKAPVSWLLQLREIAMHRKEAPGLHLGGMAYLNRFGGISKS